MMENENLQYIIKYYGDEISCLDIIELLNSD